MDMPKVGTPQATWRDDPEVRAWLRTAREMLHPDAADDVEVAMADAVAADRRIQAATLRTKIEALPLVANVTMTGLHSGDDVARGTVLEAIDAVLGGDS